MGHKLVFVPECHSTNDEAQRLLQQKGSPDGLIVITANQTAGRGQRGSAWISEPGKNLTFSIGLKPHFLDPAMQFHLSMAVSLGILDCLTSVLPFAEVKIKWPNDIMLNGKKTCGILIENQLVGQLMDRSVVGIGLNVNQVSFSFPQATSLAAENVKTFDLDALLSLLLEKLEARYLQLKAGEVEQIKHEYEQHLYWHDEIHGFLIDGQLISGIIKGITPQGKLRVLIDGVQRQFAFKEISYGYSR
ncbi:MAG: biotin--[acetyl-CoA-carboxylase] ligase [Cyclobacteriaceae bacterium]|nr:biotin--[acetyl-CoA-carboxylase] ligase [Cyclobacteriaceae bacterium]